MREAPSVMVTEIRARTHHKNSDRVLSFLNDVQEEIELNGEMWRFCQKIGSDAITITTATGDEDGNIEDRTYDLADDFMNVMAVRDVTNNQKLKAKTMGWLARYDPNMTAVGAPTFYVLGGPNGTSNVESLILDQEPGGVYTIKVPYYCRLPNLELVNDTPSRIPYSGMLKVGGEIRARIDQEEPEDGSVIRGLRAKYAVMLNALILHYAVNPDSNEGIQVDPLLTQEDIYA